VANNGCGRLGFVWLALPWNFPLRSCDGESLQEGDCLGEYAAGLAVTSLAFFPPSWFLLQLHQTTELQFYWQAMPGHPQPALIRQMEYVFAVKNRTIV
ncbi:MAG: hypothetical protein LWW81_16360, partial [Rhodocyclales bacterium]|nr:hypothetical protein [Rhodocyclales bacterium]